MTPHSPGTDQIDTLLWIGFIAAAIVVVAINVALIYAVRKFRAERGVEPRQLTGSRRVQFRVGAMLTAFAAIVFIVSIVFTGKAYMKIYPKQKNQGSSVPAQQGTGQEGQGG